MLRCAAALCCCALLMRLAADALFCCVVLLHCAVTAQRGVAARCAAGLMLLLAALCAAALGAATLGAVLLRCDDLCYCAVMFPALCLARSQALVVVFMGLLVV